MRDESVPAQIRAGDDAPVATNGDSRFQPLMDEQTLLEEYEQVRRRTSRIESDWNAAASESADPWTESVTDLRRRLDDLSQRIERDEF